MLMAAVVQEWQTDATYGDNLLSVALLSDDTVVATTDGAVTEQGAVVAVDAEDGGVLWRYDAKGIIARGGASFSPDGDRIYVGTYWGEDGKAGGQETVRAGGSGLDERGGGVLA